MTQEAINSKDIEGCRKPSLHLIPQSANILEAVVLRLGARKYGGPFNWRTTRVHASVYLSATMRHLAQWLDGQDDDAESGVSHLAHARACLGILLDAQSVHCLIDDRPLPGVAHELIVRHTTADKEWSE